MSWLKLALLLLMHAALACSKMAISRSPFRPELANTKAYPHIQMSATHAGLVFTKTAKRTTSIARWINRILGNLMRRTTLVMVALTEARVPYTSFDQRKWMSGGAPIFAVG